MNYKWKLLLIIPLLLSFQASEKNLNSTWLALNTKNSLNPHEQSYCLIKDNKPYGMNINKRMKPASVSKLYTSFWALKELGAYFRFQTNFFLENKTLYIQTGHDPFFVTENFFLIIEHLNSLGIFSLEQIKISPSFMLNWTDKENKITKDIKEIFNTKEWSSFIKQTYNQTNHYLDSQEQRPIQITQMQVKKVSFEAFHLEEISFSHYSSELFEHLKQVNIYSNNFYSDKIFHFLGGENSFEKFILQELNETKEDIYFYTGSGLGNNYTTCRITLELLQKLETEIHSHNLKIENVIAVGGLDGGTLGSRFKETLNKDLVVAKTGTLRDTSTLAGFLGNEHLPFVIFNHSFNATKSKRVQNLFVNEIIREFKIDQRIGYEKEEYLSISDVKIK